MKRLTLLFSCLLFLAHNSYSQGPTVVNLTPPSPNVSALQKYGEIPVSAYTGIPDISIPIYTVNFRDVSFPISISYHASGIRVNEEASHVGLGWALNASGLISRNILGGDDFNGSTYFNGGPTGDLTDFSNGVGPNFPMQVGCNVQMHGGSTPYYDLSGLLQASPAKEFQPDQYYYSIPGHSGKFILLRNGQAALLKQENLKIIVDFAGPSFKILTAEGFTYEFAAQETYTDIATHISAWYLSKITSPLGNIVTFSYGTIANTVQSTGSYTEKRDDWDFGYGNSESELTNDGLQAGAVPSKDYQCKFLSSIDFQNGIVDFAYSTDRLDLPHDKKLDSIRILPKGSAQSLKTFALVYDYFNGTVDQSFNAGMSASITKRLKLTQVVEKGYFNGQLIQNPPYIFTYNEMNNGLPAKTSFARDHWGYFNGHTGLGSLIPSVVTINTTDPILGNLGFPGPERDPDPQSAQAFILTSIKYPTGGLTEFQYESNDFDEAASLVHDQSYFQVATHGANSPVPVSSTLSYNAENSNYPGGATFDLTHEYTAIIPGGGLPMVTVHSVFRFSGGQGGNCNDVGVSQGQIYYVLKDASGGIISQIDPFELALCNSGQSNSPCVVCSTNSPVMTFTNTYELAPGVYTWEVHVGNSEAASKLKDVFTTLTWYELADANSGQPSNLISVGGGLRIKRIINHDGIDEHNNMTRRFEYHYLADKDNNGFLSEYSYGKRMSKPQYSYFTLGLDDYSVKDDDLFCTLREHFFSGHLCRFSDSNNPLNGSAGGSPVGYDQVTEFIGENGEFGKKVYQYHNESDAVLYYALRFSQFNFPILPPANSTIADQSNGLLLNETDYVYANAKYYKARELVNDYNDLKSVENVVFGIEQRIPDYYLHGDKCWSHPPTICDENSLVFSYQSIKSEWNRLVQSSEKTYSRDYDNPTVFEIVTNYFYDNLSHLQPTRIVTHNSRGEQLTTTIRYPDDFTIAVGASDAFLLGIKNLQDKHIKNIPIEKFIRKESSTGVDMGVTSSLLTSFKSSIPKPDIAYLSLLRSPSTTFTASTVNGSGLVKDPSYQPIISFDNYDNNGNLSQQHKISDINKAYLWDYNNSLLIAEVTNAAQNEFAATSFEADGSGNWTIPSTTRIQSAVTGYQSYNLSSGAITASGLPAGKSYIVSYWSTGGAATVNGVSPTTGLTRNGWTYYQHILPPSTTTVTVNGSATIDELRLYPQNARMSTYTYSPLIGILSTCSDNNMIQRFDYDALGRLSRITDQDGNIIKTAEYHLQNQVGQ